MPASASSGTTTVVNTLGLAGDEPADLGAHRVELLGRAAPVGRGGADTRHDLLLQARDADLHELVEVGGEDREELGALEHRPQGVLGEREHPGVEREPRQLAVEEPGGIVGASAPAGGSARGPSRSSAGSLRVHGLHRTDLLSRAPSGRDPLGEASGSEAGAASGETRFRRTPAEARGRRDRTRTEPGDGPATPYVTRLAVR